MIPFLVGLAICLAIWGAGRGVIQIRARARSRGSRANRASLAMVLVAILFGLRGHLEISALALGFAWWHRTERAPSPRLRFGATALGAARRLLRPGAVSTLRTAMIEMRIDHATGAMRGTVLAGIFAGRELELMTKTRARLARGSNAPSSMPKGRGCYRLIWTAASPDGVKTHMLTLTRARPGVGRVR